MRGVIYSALVVYVRAGSGWDETPGPPLGRDELVDDHLPDVGLRMVETADLPPARMRADQHFLDHILSEGTVSGQHAGEPQHGRQPRIRELLECHRTSLIGLSDEYTQARGRCAVLGGARVHGGSSPLYVMCRFGVACRAGGARFFAEDSCHAEEKVSFLTPFLPPSTDLPLKSGSSASGCGGWWLRCCWVRRC